MATTGLKHPVFSPIISRQPGQIPTYGAGFVIGKGIKADVTITSVEGKLYGDDSLIEYASKIQGGTISFGVDEISHDNRVTMFGNTKSTSGSSTVLIKGVNDTPQHGGFGYYKTKVIDGVKKYEAKWFYDTVFKEGNDSAETANDNINFSTVECEGTILPVVGLDNDSYLEESIFTLESQAITWLHTKANITGAAAASVASASAPATTTTKNS